MFSSRRALTPDLARPFGSPEDLWRLSADEVWMRWEAFRGAPREERARAFAAYLAALDAEASAADDLAACSACAAAA